MGTIIIILIILLIYAVFGMLSCVRGIADLLHRLSISFDSYYDFMKEDSCAEEEADDDNSYIID